MIGDELAARSIDLESVSDGELVDLILFGRQGMGSGLGRLLLRRFGGLRGLARSGFAELMEYRGIGRARAERIFAMIALARRLSREPLHAGRRYRTSHDIFRHFQPSLRDLKKERFLTVLLDGKHRVIGKKMISEGSLTASLVHPREVFSPAIREAA